MSEVIYTGRGTVPNRSSNYTGQPRGDRGYSDTDVNNPKAGQFVYAKAGAKVYYYRGSDGAQTYEGDRQDSAPFRTNGEEVGTTTGITASSTTGEKMIQVAWVNTYWRKGYLKISLNPKKALDALKGERITESVTSWVKVSLIYLTKEPETAEDKKDDTTPPPPPPGGDGGLDTETLMYAGIGIAAAMLLTGKKKKR